MGGSVVNLSGSDELIVNDQCLAGFLPIALVIYCAVVVSVSFL